MVKRSYAKRRRYFRRRKTGLRSVTKRFDFVLCCYPLWASNRVSYNMKVNGGTPDYETIALGTAAMSSVAFAAAVAVPEVGQGVNLNASMGMHFRGIAYEVIPHAYPAGSSGTPVSACFGIVPAAGVANVTYAHLIESNTAVVIGTQPVRKYFTRAQLGLGNVPESHIDLAKDAVFIAKQFGATAQGHANALPTFDVKVSMYYSMKEVY